MQVEYALTFESNFEPTFDGDAGGVRGWRPGNAGLGA